METVKNKKISYMFLPKEILWIITAGFFCGLLTSSSLTLQSKGCAIILADSTATDSVIISPVADSITNTGIPLTFNYENVKNYIFDNLHYPQEAIKKEIEGKVYISFDIEPDGKTSNIKIVRSVHPLLDQEAVRLIENMPHWKPIFYKNMPQRLTYKIPVIFLLKE